MGTKTFSKKLIAFVSAVTLSIGATLGTTSLNLTCLLYTSDAADD